MKVLGQVIIDDFRRRYPDVSMQLSTWLVEAEAAEWKTPMDIRQRYASASFLPDNRVVFNLKGPKYRLDVKVDYAKQLVIIKRVGTHSDYMNWKF